MHALLTILAAGTATTTKSSGKSSSSTLPLLLIVVVFAAVYLLFIRPRQQKLRQQQSAARTLAVGDEVVTAGGIYGRVVAMDTEVAEVEVAPGVVMTFLRRAVNPRPGTAPQEPPHEEWPIDKGGPADSGRPVDKQDSAGAGPDDPPGDQAEPHP